MDGARPAHAGRQTQPALVKAHSPPSQKPASKTALANQSRALEDRRSWAWLIPPCLCACSRDAQGNHHLSTPVPAALILLGNETETHISALLKGTSLTWSSRALQGQDTGAPPSPPALPFPGETTGLTVPGYTGAGGSLSTEGQK